MSTNSKSQGDCNFSWPEFDTPFDNGISGILASPKTRRELTMMKVSAAIRRKPYWYEKFKNPEIVSKWRKEADYQGLTNNQISYIFQELEFYASMRHTATGIEVADVDGVWRSDDLIDEKLRMELLEGVKLLEEIPEIERDWHPGSNKQVWNLVHPSLYPFIYGQTPVFEGSNYYGAVLEGIFSRQAKEEENNVAKTQEIDQGEGKDFAIQINDKNSQQVTDNTFDGNKCVVDIPVRDEMHEDKFQHSRIGSSSVEKLESEEVESGSGEQMLGSVNESAESDVQAQAIGSGKVSSESGVQAKALGSGKVSSESGVQAQALGSGKECSESGIPAQQFGSDKESSQPHAQAQALGSGDQASGSDEELSDSGEETSGSGDETTGSENGSVFRYDEFLQEFKSADRMVETEHLSNVNYLEEPIQWSSDIENESEQETTEEEVDDKMSFTSDEDDDYEYDMSEPEAGEVESSVDDDGSGLSDMENQSSQEQSQEYNEYYDTVSKEFCWLPTEFKIKRDGTAEITSYINNLHPCRFGHLYVTVGKIFSKFVPLFENVLQDQITPRENRINTYDLNSGEETEGNTKRKFKKPDAPETFVPPPAVPEKDRISLLGQNVQVIVKMANIVLTPDKPKYPGGVWHVEGMENEGIVATGIYYYDVENITDSELAFRRSILNPTYNDYEEDEDRLERHYGIVVDHPMNQILGSVATTHNRCLAFPNLYQHRVRAFQLADITKPGHRKILVFFLINPGRRITSTSSVPPQQFDWIIDELQEIPQFRRFPLEILHQITKCLDYPLTLKKAKKIRRKLMAERKYFISKNTQEYFERPFSFCEH